MQGTQSNPEDSEEEQSALSQSEEGPHARAGASSASHREAICGSEVSKISRGQQAQQSRGPQALGRWPSILPANIRGCPASEELDLHGQTAACLT